MMKGLTSSLWKCRATLVGFLALLIAGACGTLEVGVERPVTTEGARVSAGGAPVTEQVYVGLYMTPTPVPEDYVPPTLEPASTPVPVDAYPAPKGLSVAFVQDGNVWLWTVEGEKAVPLSSTGDVNGIVKISDDGAIVAFVRGDGEWWMVNGDGSGERELVSAAGFDAMEPADPGIKLHRFDWVLGTHTLAFNTRQRISDKSVLNDDLRLVDADTLEQVVLLPPGEGGEFYYAPDGSQVAVVTPGDISLIDADGENRRDSIMTYTPVATDGAYDYYARPFWAADGSALRVAIPPADLQTRPDQYTSIWHIPTDGSPGRLMTSIPSAPSIDPDVIAFSPDLAYVAYPQMRQSRNVSVAEAEIWLEVRRLENGDTIAYPDVTTVYGWAPDSRHLAFLSGRQTPQFQIGQYSGRTIAGSVDAGTPVYDVRWVDADHYLCVARRDGERGAEGDSWELILGDIDGSSAILASMADLSLYDFANTRPATP